VPHERVPRAVQDLSARRTSVGLKSWLARLLDRRRRTLFRFGGRRRTRSQHDENAYREASRDEQEETITAHDRVVCDGSSLTDRV